MTEEKVFIIKVYSKSELAALYGISAKTFAKWLDICREKNPDIFPEKKKDHSHLLTPRQVKKFVEHHGTP